MKTRIIVPLVIVMGVFFGVQVSIAAPIEELTKQCSDCHKKDGNSADGETPHIAGMSPGYFKESMAAYQSGARPAKVVKRPNKPDTDMKAIVEKLNAKDIEALAAFYSKQKYQPHVQNTDANKAKAGEKLHQQYCDKCHENAGRSGEDDAGILAGQPLNYLRYSFESYAKGQRKTGEKMEKKFKIMQEKAGMEGIEQLIHFYASQK